MGYLAYSPTRSLIGGSDGKLETVFQQATPGHKDNATQKQSLDRSNIETTYFGREKIYSVKSGLVDVAAWAKWEEFEHSCAGGESFTFDSAGTEASPVNAISVKMVLKSWKVSQSGPRHQTYTFKVRVN